MGAKPTPPQRLLTTAEVAAIFKVAPRTVNRWDSKLHAVRTLGGHRRFHRSEVLALAGHQQTPASDSSTDSASGDLCVICSAPAVRNGAGLIFQWMTVACPSASPHEHQTADGDTSVQGGRVG